LHSIHIATKAQLLSVVAAAVGILIAAMLTFAASLYGRQRMLQHHLRC